MLEVRRHILWSLYSAFQHRKIALKKASFDREFRWWKTLQLVKVHVFKLLSVLLPPSTYRLFISIPSHYIPANPCSSNSLPPTPHSYHILFLQFITQFLSTVKKIHKDNTQRIKDTIHIPSARLFCLRHMHFNILYISLLCSDYEPSAKTSYCYPHSIQLILD